VTGSSNQKNVEGRIKMGVSYGEIIKKRRGRSSLLFFFQGSKRSERSLLALLIRCCW
jgi:hypothetical protein